MTGSLSKNKTPGLIGYNLFVFFLCLFFLTSSPSNVYDTDAASARYEVTKALVERHDLSIPKGMGVRGPDDRDYSCYGIGWSVLAAPAYVIGKYMGNPEGAVSLMNQIFGAASAVLVFFFSISLGYSLTTSVFVSLFYGLGTIAWPLSKHPFDHTTETFFILLSVFFLCIYQFRSKLPYLLSSALSLGIALLVRYTAILIIPALFLMLIFYSSRRKDARSTAVIALKRMALFSAALMPFIGLALWYNYYRFGSVFETGFSLITARAGKDFFLAFAATPLLTGLTGLLISPGKGFFFYSPVAALFFFSIKSFATEHREAAIGFILMIVAYLLFHAKFGHWSGDWAWGPRYLLAITPFFIIPTAELISRAEGRGKSLLRSFLSTIFLASLLVQIAAVSVDFQNYFIDLQVVKKVKFDVTRIDGVPSNIELPVEVYFDWGKSPILAQLRFIKNIAVGMKNYHYSEPPADMALSEMIKSYPRMNVFDFWWVYRYYLTGGDYSGFLVASVLFFTVLFAAIRLRKSVTIHRKSMREYECIQD